MGDQQELIESTLTKRMTRNIVGLVDYLTKEPVNPHTRRELASVFGVRVGTILRWLRIARNVLGHPILPSPKGLWYPRSITEDWEMDLYMQTQGWAARSVQGAIGMKHVVEEHKTKQIT